MTGTVKRFVIALMVVLALVAAACSSSKKSSTTTTAASSNTTAASSNTTAGGSNTTAASGGGSSSGLNNAGGGSLADQANKAPLAGKTGSGLTRGITTDSITVGCVSEVQNFAGYEQGLRARIERANKDGGVNGRKINLLPCKDDSAGVQANLSAIQGLVNQNNAFAVFTLSQFVLSGSTDFLQSNEVPYYGWGFLPGFCGNRWGFGWNGCLAGNTVTAQQDPVRAIQGALADAIIKASGMDPTQVKLAVQADNSAAGKAGNPQYNTLYKARGAQVVYLENNFPANVAGADVTPYVQAMVAAKPNIVMISTPFADVGPIAAGLTAAGYTGVRYDYTNYIPGLLASAPQLAKALDGEYVNTQIVPAEQNTPFIQQINTDLQAIGQKPFVTLGGEIGYIEGEQFVEELQAVGQDLNTKTWDQKVNGGGFTAYKDLQGGPGPMQFPAGHDIAADCAAIVKISGTSYNVVTPFQCYSSLPVTS
ncbi:MAG TPA: ABC transporter substrate-binding protein [Acidimicrobiales bacterium]|nr:ABC transporter substrate-binding protein [Acidimicrobiales bacterium]